MAAIKVFPHVTYSSIHRKKYTNRALLLSTAMIDKNLMDKLNVKVFSICVAFPILIERPDEINPFSKFI